METSIHEVIEKENRKWPKVLAPVPRHDWPSQPAYLCEVWRSRDFLVQIYRKRGVERLSVCRTALQGTRWADGITWDELQALKRECGRGHKTAIEIYPPDEKIVNGANMRHLWIMDKPPEFMWGA